MRNFRLTLGKVKQERSLKVSQVAALRFVLNEESVALAARATEKIYRLMTSNKPLNTSVPIIIGYEPRPEMA